MLKNRIKKQEDRQPRPAPTGIIYKAVWGDSTDTGPFIAEWKENEKERYLIDEEYSGQD